MSSVTVQRAVHELKRQGFLTTKRRLGTFISEKSPWLNNYALVFPQDPVRSAVWSNFYEGLRLAGEKINQTGGKNVNFFYAIEEFDRSDDYVRLVRLVKNHQISGIIFAAPPHNLLDTPLMREPNMPRVAISGITTFNIPLVSHGWESSLTLAAKYLAGRNLKQIALFAISSGQRDEWLRRQADFSRLGISTREQWCFTIPAIVPETAKACARLLMDMPRANRPDGIIVIDDHLTEAVERGLMSASDVSARETQIVALCNFPDRFAHHLPIKRLGCNVADFLHTCIDIIDAQCQGRKVPHQTFIESHFDK